MRPFLIAALFAIVPSIIAPAKAAAGCGPGCHSTSSGACVVDGRGTGAPVSAGSRLACSGARRAHNHKEDGDEPRQGTRSEAQTARRAERDLGALSQSKSGLISAPFFRSGDVAHFPGCPNSPPRVSKQNGLSAGASEAA